jgi:hypothetical protein
MSILLNIDNALYLMPRVYVSKQIKYLPPIYALYPVQLKGTTSVV